MVTTRVFPAVTLTAVALASCSSSTTAEPEVVTVTATEEEVVVEERAETVTHTATSTATASPSRSSSSEPTSNTASGAMAALNDLPVKGRAPKTGYDRDLFGQTWSDDVSEKYGRNGCDTRIICTPRA